MDHVSAESDTRLLPDRIAGRLNLKGEAAMERGHVFERENLSDISSIKLS
jgi:hypothetical protein